MFTCVPLCSPVVYLCSPVVYLYSHVFTCCYLCSPVFLCVHLLITCAGEHVVELGMYLDLLNTSCFPTWPEVFAIAECVMQRLQDEDPELHDHLKHIASINVQGHPKVRP